MARGTRLVVKDFRWAVKGIAFDLEGTVVDVEAAHHEAHLRVCRDRGLDLTLEEAIAKIPHFIGGPDRAVAEDIVSVTGKFDGEVDPIQTILEKDAEYYEEILSTMKIEPRPGFLDVFRWFTRHGFGTSIGSLTDDEKAHFLLDRSGLSAMFDPYLIVLKSHVKNLKPAPDVFIETANRMGIDPRDQLVFEDSPRGACAAIAAGSQVVGMPVYENAQVIAELTKAGALQIFLNWRAINPALLIDSIDGRYSV